MNRKQLNTKHPALFVWGLGGWRVSSAFLLGTKERKKERKKVSRAVEGIGAGRGLGGVYLISCVAVAV